MAASSKLKSVIDSLRGFIDNQSQKYGENVKLRQAYNTRRSELQAQRQDARDKRNSTSANMNVLRSNKDATPDQIKAAEEAYENAVSTYNSIGTQIDQLDNDYREAGGSNDPKQRKRLSDTFYRDVSANISGKPAGNTLDSAARAADAQAMNGRNAKGKYDMSEQQSRAIASNNPYSEAGKIASVQNDTQNRQNVRNSNVVGNQATLSRATNAPDVVTQQNRADQQRNVANEQMSKGIEEQYNATQKEGEADTFRTQSAQADRDTNTSDWLARGNDYTLSDDFMTELGNAFRHNPEEQTPEAQPENTPPEVPENIKQLGEAGLQDILNVLAFTNDPSSTKYESNKRPEGDRYRKAYEVAISNGYEPLSADEINDITSKYTNQNDSKLLQEAANAVYTKNPAFKSISDNSDFNTRIVDGVVRNRGDTGRNGQVIDDNYMNQTTIGGR